MRKEPVVLLSGRKGIPGRVNELRWLELKEGEASEGEIGSRQGPDNRDYSKEFGFFFLNRKTLEGFQ